MMIGALAGAVAAESVALNVRAPPANEIDGTAGLDRVQALARDAPHGRLELRGRQRCQAIGAPRHQRHAMTMGSENARQLGAYSGRRAGNQRYTLGHDGMLLIINFRKL